MIGVAAVCGRRPAGPPYLRASSPAGQPVGMEGSPPLRFPADGAGIVGSYFFTIEATSATLPIFPPFAPATNWTVSGFLLLKL